MPHQLALCDYVPFHRRIEPSALCASHEIQFLIQRENLEDITMRAGRRARSAIAGFAEIISSLRPFWRASFRDRRARLRRNVPSNPMRKQPARRIWIIDNQDKALGFRRNFLNLQRWLVSAPSHENLEEIFAPC